MPKILFHTCCSPCACQPIEELVKQGFEVTIFYYNPNVQPREEYDARLAELKKYLQEWPMVEIIEGEYEVEKWLEQIKGLESEPERGRRCDVCYEMRLRKTAEQAKKLGYEYFGSSLSISPHKKAEKISELGQKIAAEMGVKFLDRDWKKMGGWQQACALAKEHNFYRQNYCGCVFSKSKMKNQNEKLR
ncbi:MAG TPA: epoxyqueuosine reductase QueH [Patescibacteria group bacterium]|nr:epoxyqueuosine reductase QueH [Patescibacteria group bacterium]